jgi:acetyl-CoA synthetase
LHKNVCKIANGFKSLGIKKGDVVTIYMPMIPEIAYVMLACTRIGAIHSVIFGGFSAESVSGRLDNCNSEYIITADAGMRGCKAIPLKKTIDDSLKICKVKIKKVVVVKTQEKDYAFDPNIDIYYHDLIKD